MKLHKEFGTNAVKVICPCCGKTTGYIIQGDSIQEDVRDKYIIGDSICTECKERLETQTIFIACELNNDGKITIVYDAIWIKNIGLKEFFKDLSVLNPINLINKEVYYTVFKDVLNDLINNKDEDNRTECRTMDSGE